MKRLFKLIIPLLLLTGSSNLLFSQSVKVTTVPGDLIVNGGITLGGTEINSWSEISGGSGISDSLYSLASDTWLKNGDTIKKDTLYHDVYVDNLYAENNIYSNDSIIVTNGTVKTKFYENVDGGGIINTTGFAFVNTLGVQFRENEFSGAADMAIRHDTIYANKYLKVTGGSNISGSSIDTTAIYAEIDTAQATADSAQTAVNSAVLFTTYLYTKTQVDSICNAKLDSALATVVTDTTLHSSQIQSVINNYSHVIFRGGIFEVDSTILIPSNFHLEIAPDATLRLSGAVRTDSIWLMTNADTTNGNTNIIIDGGGTIDGNESQRILIPAEKPYTGQTICFIHVSKFTMRDIKIQNSLRFNCQIADVENFIIDNIHLYTAPNSIRENDGIHITGPAKNGNISRIFGVSTEDLIAILADDWDHLVVTEGDVENIVIENIMNSDANTGSVRFLAENHSTKNITIRNFFSTSKLAFLNLSTYKVHDTATFSNIVCENIYFGTDSVMALVTTGDSANVMDVRFTGVYGGKFVKLVNANDYTYIDDIKLEDLNIGVLESSTGLNYFYPYCNIQNFTIDGFKTNDYWTKIIGNLNDVTINNFTVKNIECDSIGYFLYHTFGIINRLVFDNIKINDYSNTCFQYASGHVYNSEFKNLNIHSDAGTLSAIGATGTAITDSIFVKNSNFNNVFSPIYIGRAGIYEFSDVNVYGCKSFVRSESTTSGVRFTAKNSKFGQPQSASLFLYTNNADVDYLDFTNIEIDSAQYLVNFNGTNTIDFWNIDGLKYSQVSGYNMIDNLGVLTSTTMKFNNISTLSNNIVGFFNARTSAVNITNFQLSNSNFMQFRQILNLEPNTTITNCLLTGNKFGQLAAYYPIDNLGTITNLTMSDNIFTYSAYGSSNDLINNTGTISKLLFTGNSITNAYRVYRGMGTSVNTYLTFDNNIADNLYNFLKFEPGLGGFFSIFANSNQIKTLNNTAFVFDSLTTAANCYFDWSGYYADAQTLFSNAKPQSCRLFYKDSGTATLVAGTVTVNTTAVQSTSDIMLSCKTAGGTQGFLSVGTIVAGTSFIINSSSATDTSTIIWQIK